MPTRADLPRFVEYLPPLVAALKARGGSATIDELEEDVAARMGLSDDLLAVPMASGTQQSYFSYRLSWARSFLKKAGAAENSERGVWRLTPLGAAMSDEELRAIVPRIRAEDRRARLGRDRDDEPATEQDIAEEISWKERLLELLLAMSPAAFERLSQRLLREAGFIKVEVTGRSGDGGIDGIGVLRVQLVSFQVLFQSKRWKGSVGASVVRDFRGAMIGRADKGLIITTATFTADARREATRDGAPVVDLVNGETLADLLKQYRIGVGVQMVEEVEVNAEFFQSI
jgi:restriction system protein